MIELFLNDINDNDLCAQRLAQKQGGKPRAHQESSQNRREIGQQLLEEMANEQVRDNGGDDYELCFTVAPAHEQAVSDIAAELDIPMTRIGQIDKGQGARVVHAAGGELKDLADGFDHFDSHG